MNFKPNFVALSVLSCLSVPAMAQTQDIEHILVTSDFRLQSLQHTPKSLTLVSEQDIQQRQAQALEEILNLAPNVNFNSGAGRGRYIQIRGIGERSQFKEPSNPSVGVLVDDMDFSGIGGVGTLFDVEQVEILRGPQGTEFGAGAMAGVVKVKTKGPSDSPQGQVSLSLAEKNTWNLGAAYGDAINDQWQYRVAVEQFKSDGFIENIHLNRDDTDNLDELTSRLKLRYLASERLTLDFSYQYFDIDNGYDAFSLDNDSRTRSDKPGFDRQKTHAYSVNADWKLDWANVKAIANISRSDMDYGFDEDWTYVGFSPNEYVSTDYYFRERDTNSLDIRMLSNDASKIFSDTTQWVAGIYWRETDENLLRQHTFNSPDFTSDYQPRTLALYGQLNSQLSTDWSLTLGLRAERSSIDYRDNTGFSDKVEDTMIGGKLVLEYQASDDTNLYASINRGYKLGGVNPDKRVAPALRVYAPEFNWNYEFGIKRNYMQGRGYMRFAAFYVDRSDTQVNDFDVQKRADGTPDFLDIIGNADVGKNYGIELENQWQTSDRVQVFLNLGLLETEFGGYTNAKGELVKKRDLAQAPGYTFNVGTKIDITDTLFLRIEADGKDAYFFSDGHDGKSNSYTLVNTRLQYQMDEWTLALWGKNLFDREYYVRGFGGFSNDPRDNYANPQPYYQVADGRMIGISANFQF